MTPTKIGMVGLGVISEFYSSAVPRLPAVEVTAVCDVNEDALDRYRGAVDRYRDHRTLLERADVDAIVVNVPNDRHFEICRDGILSGRAVCVEKPLATNVDDGRELVRLAREHETVLFTAFHRRYNDNVLALMRRVAEAAPIESMTVRYFELIEDHVGRDRWYLDPERCGGGCVADNGPNAFDLVRMFLGDVHLRDAIIKRDEHGVDREASITLRTAQGVTARVELDWSYGAGELKDVEVRLSDGRVDGADMLAGHPRFKSSLAHEYVGVLRDFDLAVRHGLDRAGDGMAALDLVERAYRFERSGTTAPAGGGERP